MLESLKNQDDYGSRAFRCCWTRQTCSLLKTDLRGLPGAVASITWLAALVRGGLWSCPPGLVLIAQLLRSSVPAVLDGNRPRAQNVLPCHLSRHSRNLETFTDFARPN